MYSSHARSIFIIIKENAPSLYPCLTHAHTPTDTYCKFRLIGTLFFGTDRDRGLGPRDSGAVRGLPVTTCDCLPTKLRTASTQLQK
jgi:hypothetical protein